MEAEYAAGTRVRVNNRDDHGHIKLPRFAPWDGRVGTVVASELFESTMLDDQNPMPGHRYSVRFDDGEVVQSVPENIVQPA